MAYQTNMDHVRRRRAQIAREAEERENAAYFDKLKEGGNKRRILPPWSAEGNWRKYAAYHYKLGKRGFVCLKKTFGKTCPACDYVAALYEEKTQDSLVKAKEYRAKDRFFANVLNLDSNDGKVYVMAFGQQLEESILDAMDGGSKENTGGDTFGVGDITHPKTGRNLLVTKDVPPGKKEQTSYKAQASMNPSEVPNWAEVEKKLYDLDAIVQKDVLSEEDIWKVLNGEQIAERPESNEAPAAAGAASVAHTPAAGAGTTVSSEFEKLGTGKVDEFGRPGGTTAAPTTQAPVAETASQPAAPVTPTGGGTALARLKAMKESGIKK